MILPGHFIYTLVLVILGLLCWGSWANFFKAKPPRWRFELYYFDFVIGLLATVLIICFTFGQLGYDGFSVTDDLVLAGKRQELWAFLAGAIFNLGNMMLIGATSLSGMTVAFSIALSVASAEMAYWTFYPVPHGNVGFLFTGAIILIAAAIFAVIAYRPYTESQMMALIQEGKTKSTRKVVSPKAIIVSVLSGLLIGGFLPLLDMSRVSEIGLGPYSAIFVMALGVFSSTVVYEMFFINLPLAGDPADIGDYLRAKGRTHRFGLTAGALWAIGILAFEVAARAEAPADIASYIVFGARLAPVLIVALWGLVKWNEFRNADGKVRFFLFLMLVALVAGIGLMIVSQVGAH